MDFESVLPVVQEAAEDAGELLRAEFYCPSGPRGQCGRCDADVEAERIIRQRLRAAFPSVGVVGEELGATDQPGNGDYRFLVDPNDGTSAFLKGHRGSAVSIGLLRAGIPVLGVVYSPTARAGCGDVFTWFEGGSLRRNGQIVSADAPSTGLVALSQAADSDSETNQSLCGENRFIAVTSVAYRLALAAAGEVDAGLSLASPVGWDLAGASALLRHRGGILLGRRYGSFDLRPLAFDPAHGDIPETYAAAGGDSGIAEVLLEQPWEEVGGRRSTRLVWDLCPPKPGATVDDARLLNAGQGLMMGLLAGDALGSAVEFRRADEIVSVDLSRLSNGGTWGLMAGQPTDDGELAILLARSIVKSGGYDPESALSAYVHWYNSTPFDIGSTTRIALSAASRSRSEQDRLRICRDLTSRSVSQSNGALMRVAPLALYANRMTLDQVEKLAGEDATLTHGHPICVDANKVYLVSLVLLLHGLEPKTVVQETLSWGRSKHLHETVLSALSKGCDGLPEDVYTRQGWVLIALQIAYHQLLHATDLADGIRTVVALGGDTDTNAAIAGALLGARFGVNDMPAQWRNSILSARPLPRLSVTNHPRPKAFWPIDALVLAERLLSLHAG